MINEGAIDGCRQFRVELTVFHGVPWNLSTRPDPERTIDQVLQRVDCSFPCRYLKVKRWTMLFFRLITVLRFHIGHWRRRTPFLLNGSHIFTCDLLCTPRTGLVHITIQDCLVLDGKTLGQAVDEINDILIPSWLGPLPWCIRGNQFNGFCRCISPK